MCGLCGILGGKVHWSDTLAAGAAAEATQRSRAERARRIRYLNAVLAAFACTVSDWQGSHYVLSTFTGKTELVDNLTQLWAAVERLTGHAPDPLSPHVLERLAARS